MVYNPAIPHPGLLQHDRGRVHSPCNLGDKRGLQEMNRNFQRKTLQITGVHDFEPEQFLRRLQKSSINAGLIFIIDTRTRIFLSVYDKTYIRKNKAFLKLSVIRNLLDGCSFEESILPNITGNGKVLIHVVGAPVSRETQVEELVAKLIDSQINSNIFVNLSSVYTSGAGMDCPFRVTFSISVSGASEEELRGNVATVASLIQAIYDNNSIQLIYDRRPVHSVKRLIAGGHIYGTVLDVKQVSTYFQLPLTYGIEPVKKMDFPLPVSPFSGIVIGTPAEINIQEIDKVRLDPDRLFEHMAMWGASGTGKTTLLKNMLINLGKTDVKFTVLDWHNEYRSIATRLNGKLGEDTIILNPLLRSLSISPLELRETKTQKEILVWERIENFISMMKQMFILGEIQEAKIRESLSRLYTVIGCPTISEMITSMNESKMKSLTMKLQKFSQGFYGQIFNQRHSSLSFSELRKKNVIIELGQLPAEVRMFFTCVFLILWWDHMRLGEIHPNILILDDFYRYSKLSVVRNMLSEARKFKQGLICSHQGPYQLPEGMREEVVRNTATKIIFRQEQTWDKHIVRDALGGLEKRQLEALSYLDIGQAIVKLPSVNFPIRVNTPPPPQASRQLFDGEITQLMRNFIKEQEPGENQEIGEPIEKKFLREIKNRSGESLTKIIKLLGIKTIRGYQLKDKMINEGYIDEEKIRSGIGRPRSVYRITKKGTEYLDTKSKNEAPQYGKQEHTTVRDRIVSQLKSWKVEIEKGCDIKAEKEGFKVAIEVETCKGKQKNQIAYNVDRDLTWADEVIVVCPNKQAKLKITEILREMAHDVKIITYRQISKINDILGV